jgi:hypothetical protein
MEKQLELQGLTHEDMSILGIGLRGMKRQMINNVLAQQQRSAVQALCWGDDARWADRLQFSGPK